MSLYGTQYEEEIDEIARLTQQHLEKYGKENLPDAIDRILGAVGYGIKDVLQYKNENKTIN